jgi:hypothetical protein
MKPVFGNDFIKKVPLKTVKSTQISPRRSRMVLPKVSPVLSMRRNCETKVDLIEQPKSTTNISK